MPTHNRVPGSSPRKRKQASHVNNLRRPSIDNYHRLTDVEKAVVYFYKIYLDTDSLEGWNIDKAGSVTHWRHYEVIFGTWKTDGTFRSRAKSLATLARKLHEEGVFIAEPKINGLPPTPSTRLLGKPTTPEELASLSLKPPGRHPNSTASASDTALNPQVPSTAAVPPEIGAMPITSKKRGSKSKLTDSDFERIRSNSAQNTAAGAAPRSTSASMDDLEELTTSFDRWSVSGRVTENQQIIVTGATNPIVCASWGDQDTKNEPNYFGFSVTNAENDRNYNMIRMMTFNGLTCEHIGSKWIGPREMEIVFVWPKITHKAIIKSIYYNEGDAQKKEAEGQKARPPILHIKNEDHVAIKSLNSYLQNRLVKQKDNPKKIATPPRIENRFRIRFAEDQIATNDAVWIDVVNVPISNDDLEEGEPMPDGGVIRMLEIITEVKKDDDDNGDEFKFTTGTRDTNAGKSEPSGAQTDVNKVDDVVRQISDIFKNANLYVEVDKVKAGLETYFVGREDTVLFVVKELVAQGKHGYIDTRLDELVSKFPSGVRESDPALKRFIGSLPPATEIVIASGSGDARTDENRLSITTGGHSYSHGGSSLARAASGSDNARNDANRLLIATGDQGYGESSLARASSVEIDLPPILSYESDDDLYVVPTAENGMNDEDDREFEKRQRYRRNDQKDAHVEKTHSRPSPTATEAVSTFDTDRHNTVIGKKARRTTALSSHHKTFDTAKKD